ncbi:uncharacterized protein LOC116337144 [Contarinia nasturtii]|uniref:uncharacterized protein LOC116337144 n=1 Tax=Contarinia nasturtii TaxID=265458 RepID=UPI0012D37903|nr:uncharacterized protein LOC116337144 [Contarinia nasturtii]
MKLKILLVAALFVAQAIAQEDVTDVEVIKAESTSEETSGETGEETTSLPDENPSQSGNDEYIDSTTAENNDSNDSTESQSSETTEATTTINIPTTSSTPVPEFSCTSVGRFAVPGSCEKYYYCWDAVHAYAIFSCSKVFDPVTKRCVENYGVCPTAPKCEADKQVLPNPDDKSSFFECRLEKNSIPSAYEIRREDCEHGREFDEELGFCKLISPNEWTSSEVTTSEHECTRVGIFIDEKSDTHYYECIVKSVSKGILKSIRRKCPKYWIFSGADKKCVPL